MCGRYYISSDTADELEKLTGLVNSVLALKQIHRTDIHPSDNAPVLLAAQGKLDCAWLKWGFPLSSDRKKELVFNARCESVLEKPLFREGIRHRRIAVPAEGFYEWNRDKVKYTFREKQRKLLFLAGCCRQYGDGEHFVILTTGANASMLPVHDRMPLILEKNQVTDWILESDRTESLLRQLPPLLERNTEYEQLSFF